MEIDLVKKYKENIEEIDSIFETSQVLRELYTQALKKLREDLEDLGKYSIKNTISNHLQALENIEKSSIEDAESGAWERLCTQAVILVVSVSEQLLKEAFERLLESNLEEIATLDDKQFKFKDIRERSFNLTREDWVILIKEKIYGDSNPSEKINFQNIRTIQGIFSNYFNINIPLTEDESRKLHFYYQCRHTIVHNGSVIDERFLKSLKVINYPIKYKKNQKLQITWVDLDDCKKQFLDFFFILERSIKESGLEYK